MIFVATPAIYAVLDKDAVRAIQEDILPLLQTEWTDKDVHLLAARRRKLSLVDCCGFSVMRRRNSGIAFAFDRHLAEEGFRSPPG